MHFTKNFVFCFVLIMALIQTVFAQNRPDNNNDQKGREDDDHNDRFRPPRNEVCRGGFQRCVRGNDQWYRECFRGFSVYHRCPRRSICVQQGGRIRCVGRRF
ncbi:hypothetical protein BB558_000532 [Smittium angustum]|uniref:Chitin-binding type-2 domain-containing protein n=1 Tax=Smittium angustum TaxID=133377 RepID=A0A2U1JE66_SMIAN|nr:hypothetical protein BB558_000532 [Smittium angustum]